MLAEGQIVSVNISEKTGTTKHAVPSITVNDRGIVGDAHSGPWHRQVSLLSQEAIDGFAKGMKREVKPGEFAENLTVSGVDLTQSAPFDRITIGPVVLEVTQIGKSCHGQGCAIFREVGKCVMPKEGIFCRVVTGGEVKAGDKFEYQSEALRFQLITLSDRAHRGDYSDRSGPRAQGLLEEFVTGTRWRAEIETTILPDEPEQLLQALRQAKESGVDAVFTLGSTGVGPRDIAPEVVTAFCDRQIPGIMESIRMKFGAVNARALLSRSVAGVADGMLVYTLPGSKSGVTEYMGEILRSFEHLLFMLRGMDIH